MLDYTPNDIVDIILVLEEYCCNYQQAAELYHDRFPDNTKMIKPLYDLYYANVQKNDKDVVLIYPREMIRKLLQY